MLSTGVHLALSPDRTYRSLIAADAPVSAWRMLRRPLVVLIVIATAVPIMAVQRITLALFAFSIASFGFVLLIQMAIGAGILAFAPARRMTMPRALDLWFAGHVPYSLWLLTAALFFAMSPWASLDGLIALAIVPAVWTAVIVAAFCRQVLGVGPAAARWLSALHFIVIWAITLEIVALSAGGWFQITGSVDRVFR